MTDEARERDADASVARASDRTGHATAADAECLPVEWCMLILRELHNTGLRQWLSCRKNFLRHLEEEAP